MSQVHVILIPFRQKLVLLLVCVLPMLSSCEVKDIEIVEVESVNVDKVENGNIDGTIVFKLKNPNAFSVKVKAADLDIWANSTVMGNAKLTESFKIKASSTGSYPVKLKGDLSGAMTGGIGSVLGMLMGKDPKVKLKGTLTASGFLITRTIPIEEETQIPLSKLIR